MKTEGELIRAAWDDALKSDPVGAPRYSGGRLFGETASSLVAAIEARAKAVRIPITTLCKKANVSASTFTRWKSGKTEPSLRVYRRLMQMLDELSGGGAE